MNASVDKLTTAQATDLDTTKGRELREVAKEARDRERAAMAADRVADAAMYREIADRAEHVADREAKVRYASEILPAERARVERDAVERSARRQYVVGWVGIGIVVLAAVAAFSSCNPGRSGGSSRPATRGEASRAPLSFVARYEAPFVEAFWADWRGSAVVELSGPEAGLDAMPATADLGEGFDGLDGCLAGALDGSWTLDVDGVLVASFVADGGTVVRLTGRLVSRSRGPAASPRTIVGSGTWEALPGPGCGPEDFAGGRSGSWTCQQADLVPLKVDPPREPRARLLLVGSDGSVTTVTGPRSRTLSIASEVLR